MKIFITDGRSLAALAAIRSLGRDGHEIHCGEAFNRNVSSYSRYVDERVSYPDPEDDREAFVSYLLAVAEREQYDLIIPIRDAATILLSKHQDDFAEVTNVFVPEYDVLGPLMDKGETVKIADKADVPTPETWFPEETSHEKIKEQVTYPVLVRPRRSSGSRGIRYVSGPEEFDDAVDFVSEEFGTPIVQRYIDKTGYTTAGILFDENQTLVGEFSYERIKEFPLSGGPTVVGVSTDDDDAKTYAKRLLEEAEWMGPAEVEFILDEEGMPKLLEVNPRFWMPIQLAISAGVDFPSLIAELVAGNDPGPVDTYELGLTYRWVLPNELLWLSGTDQKAAGLREFLSFDPRNQCYGSLSLHDPIPVLGVILQSLVFLADAEKLRFILDRGWSS